MVQLPTEKTEINGLRVQVTKFSVRRASRLLPKLGKLIGAALSELDTQGVQDLAQTELKAIGPAFVSFFDALDDADADALALQILASTSVIKDGDLYDLDSGSKIDQTFGCDLAAYYQVLWFAIKVNFENFIGAASQILPGEVAQENPSS